MTPEERMPYQEMSLFSRQEYNRIKSMTNLERMAAAAAIALRVSISSHKLSIEPHTFFPLG